MIATFSLIGCKKAAPAEEEVAEEEVEEKAAPAEEEVEEKAERARKKGKRNSRLCWLIAGVLLIVAYIVVPLIIGLSR